MHMSCKCIVRNMIVAWFLVHISKLIRIDTIFQSATIKVVGLLVRYD